MRVLDGKPRLSSTVVRRVQGEVSDVRVRLRNEVMISHEMYFTWPWRLGSL